MTVYHMSQTLRLGDTLNPDHENTMALSQPFVQALERSEDCFYAMVLNGKYLRAVLGKFKLWEWSNYVKWSTEGAFEFIRKTEFPDSCSRLSCNYYYDDLQCSKKLYEYDWGEESEEEQHAVHLFEIELEDNAPQKRDMRLFDEAYDAMKASQDVQRVLDCARRYFAGEQSEQPVWEILSDKSARAVKDISEYLRSE